MRQITRDRSRRGDIFLRQYTYKNRYAWFTAKEVVCTWTIKWMFLKTSTFTEKHQITYVAQVFSFCEVLKNTFSMIHLWATVSISNICGNGWLQMFTDDDQQHYLKYQNFTEFPGVKILWTVSAEFPALSLKLVQRDSV